MNNEKKLSRKDFFKLGLGAMGGALSYSAFASLCGLTPPQTEGPFFPYPGTPEYPVRENPSDPLHLANDNDLTFVKGRLGSAAGQRVRIRGIVQNQNCELIKGATIVIWQASASGRYNNTQDNENTSFPDARTGRTVERHLDPNFQYWGKDISREDGSFAFKTIVPGYYPADLNERWFRPPHVHFMITALGYSTLTTQMYFRGDRLLDNEFFQELNQRDPILQSREISDDERANVIVDFNEALDPNEKIGKILEGHFIIKLRR